MSGVLNKPRLEAYVGSTGSGKGVSINRRLEELKPPRLLIWDPRNEYGRHAPRVATLPEVARALAASGGGRCRVRYVPGDALDLGEAFAYLCKLAFQAGGLVFLAEELSDVTKPSWAHPAWRRITTQGRHQGLHVIGAAQRPALLDKSFLGACTYVRAFGLRYDEDRRAMAKTLDCQQRMLDELQTTEEPTARGTRVTIRYVERDFTQAGKKAAADQIVLYRK